MQSPESFREQYNVAVELNTEATSIDRSRKVVHAVNHVSEKELSYPYDVLILAQGGKPIVPPIPGASNGNVFSLWTLRDMDGIDRWITDNAPRTSVVVGGGFIGLEMAEALHHRGLHVELVEQLQHVMPNLEPEIAGYLQQELHAQGVGLHTSRAVTRIDGTGVMLDDGRQLNADMVLLCVGVRPTLRVAADAGLETGPAGGLVVDSYLRTTDPAIYAAGDMVEVPHAVSGRPVRVPLAGPANRQGRIAATNALGGALQYRGPQGTSIVKVFDAAAGITGLSLNQALSAGFAADAAVVHKESHTAYYPGAAPVTVLLVYDRESGRLLGAQTAGHNGADKRLDVLATAVAAGMDLDQLGEVDLAYAPPFGTANDPVNMAAFVAQNRISGYSPSITVAELDHLMESLPRPPIVIDLRDPFAFQKGRIRGARNVAPNRLEDEEVAHLAREEPILLISDDGKTGHRAVRTLLQRGLQSVFNVAGGQTSVDRHAYAQEFRHLSVESAEEQGQSADLSETGEGMSLSGPLVVDVRSPEEVQQGAYPGAVNIPLDELDQRVNDLCSPDRQITVYCASGARSAYAKRMLESAGYTNVRNGGGLADMMAGRS
jgi:NADPH-dependent 2,4-dienoyl-CoA reductase/sulfur reductase-like enzyme/rhodanese-related sulfurtransferase